MFRSKIEGVNKKFNLADPKERQKYFEAKSSNEIKRIKKFFDEGKSFIAYMLGKKNAGKGTYVKMMIDIFGKDRIAHISAGDIVRDIHKLVETEKGKKEIKDYLAKNYRGYISLDEAIASILNRSQEKVSIPNEVMLALIKKEIDKHKGKSIFIDGFPRTMDQISYSLFFRDLINHREDPDLFVAIDVPETIIDARMRGRVICPKCHAPRHPRLLATREIGYDKKKDEFYLICEDSACNKARMVSKEGDSAGIESIRERLKTDSQIIEKAFSLHGMPKILIRNAMPVSKANEYADKYELTPEYSYKYNEKTGKVKTIEKPWIVKDDEGVEVYSLLAPAVVLQMVSLLAKKLDELK